MLILQFLKSMKTLYRKLLKNIKPDYIIALNLFRDQLDRYGEIDTIAKKWKDAYKNLNKHAILF